MISGLSMTLALILNGGRVCTRKLETLELGKSTSEGQVKLLWCPVEACFLERRALVSSNCPAN